MTHAATVEQQRDSLSSIKPPTESEQAGSQLNQQRFADKSNVRYLDPTQAAKAKQEQALGGLSSLSETDPSDPQKAQQADEPPLSRQIALETAKRLNEYVQTVARDLEFSIDEDTGRTVMKVMERSTGDLVRQVPDTHMLHLSKLSAELDNGDTPMSLILSQRV